MTQNSYFSPLTHTNQLLLETFCVENAGIGASFQTHEGTNEQTNMDGQTDMQVEKVI